MLFDDLPSVPEALRRAFREPGRAARVALLGPFGAITYAELETAIGGVAARLRDAGIPRQSIIGIWASRRVDAALGLLGAWQAGLVPTVFEPRLSIAELAARATTVGMRWILADETLQDEKEQLAGAGIQVVPLSPTGHHGTFFADRLEPDDGALLLFTSGSTGLPKGVLLSHGNLLVNAAGIIERTELTAADRLLHAMPLYHTNGINNQLLAPLLAGAPVAIVDRFAADELFGQIETYRPTYFTGVPTMFSRLLPHAPLPGALRSLRFARCGSAPITETLHKQIEAHLGVPLIISYGLSEATCTSTMNPPAARKIGTVGTPLPGQQVVLFKPGTHEHVAAGAEGEVCIGGPTVMWGYIGGDGADPQRAVTDGWVRTGDLGRFDADGFLSITGRLKEVIIRGGENLSPQLIESALISHPDVAACAVIGAPDTDLGEVPVAFVVRNGGALPEALQGHVASRLSRIYVPKRIVFVDALPENAVGKIDRKRLKEALAAMQPA